MSRLPRLGAAVSAALLLAAGAGGCGGSEASPREHAETTTKPSSEKPAEAQGGDRKPLSVERVPCPPDLSGCRSARGTILYVERVDPDGDGDAHFVLVSPQSITAPGISVIDVAVDLRPHPLPGPGDELAAAGQVQGLVRPGPDPRGGDPHDSLGGVSAAPRVTFVTLPRALRARRSPSVIETTLAWSG